MKYEAKKHGLLFAKDAENGDLSGQFLSYHSPIVKEILNGKAEEKPKKRIFKKEIIEDEDASRD